MRRVLWLPVLLLTICPLLPASEFDWMVRQFARQTGAQQTHIPFFGLARFVVAVGHPAGTSDLRLAVFENIPEYPKSFADIADSTVGSAWRPMIRVRSRDGEFTSIYMQPDGKQLKLLIATLDHKDATFVEVRVHPERLMSFIDEHRKGR